MSRPRLKEIRACPTERRSCVEGLSRHARNVPSPSRAFARRAKGPVTALYRKYRPLDFEEVVGQEAVVRTLRNAIEHDQVRQAYLFAGPRRTSPATPASRSPPAARST